jgi:signal transduction histidine kinase
VYVCLADADPSLELVSLCAAGIERPVTQARLRRCLAGLGAAAREHTASAANELLASVANEVRAPLQGVSGFARYLLDGKAGPVSDEQALCLQQVELGTQHVLKLVEDALELTDASVATREVQSEARDVEQALRAVLEAVQPLALERKIAVDLKLDDPVRDAVLDASKLKQVVYNLISSVLQDARSAGALSIRVSAEDAATFCVEVRDSGPGLTQPVLAALNAGRTGASATQGMLAALGGRLHAFNDPPLGTVLRLELPRRPSAKRPYLRSV